MQKIKATYQDIYPRVIKVNQILPLQDPTILKLDEKSYYIPTDLPVIGFFKKRKDHIIFASLTEDKRWLTKERYKNCLAFKPSYIHFTETNGKEYTPLGKIKIYQDSNYPQYSGILQGKNLYQIQHSENNFYNQIINLTHGLIYFRYSFSKDPPLRVEEILYPTFYPQKKDPAKKTLEGYIEHSDVKTMYPNKPFKEEIVKLITPKKKIFTLKKRATIKNIERKDPIEITAPIIGLYSHPFNPEKIILARLDELDEKEHNFIYITELGKEEQTIGYMYFQREENKIIVKDFGIGINNCFSWEELPNKGRIYRNKGLGSRVLETAEELFKRRYKAKKVTFQHNIDNSQKMFTAKQYGKFLRNNYYCRKEFTKPHPSLCDFEKKLESLDK